LNNIL